MHSYRLTSLCIKQTFFTLRFQGSPFYFFSCDSSQFYFLQFFGNSFNQYFIAALNSPTCQRLSTLKKDGVLSSKVSRNSRTIQKALKAFMRLLSSLLTITRCYIRTYVSLKQYMLLFACFRFRFNSILLLFSSCRTIYRMCSQKLPHDYSMILYDKYKEVFEEYIKSTVSNNVKH